MIMGDYVHQLEVMAGVANPGISVGYGSGF